MEDSQIPGSAWYNGRVLPRSATWVRLDAAGHHRLELAAGEASLRSVSAERYSELERALRRHLRLRVDDGVELELPEGGGGVALPAGARRLELLLGPGRRGAPRVRLAALDLDTGEALAPGCVLGPFECRFLADTRAPHPGSGAPSPRATPRTDLHAHLAGCAEPAALVELGRDHGVVIPRALLAAAGIRSDVDRALGELAPPLLEAYARRLAVPLDRQVPFREMEAIYRLRAPVTKCLAAFPALLRRVASDYARMGARYVELSMHQAVEAAWLREIHRVVPEIERETGVVVRFLAAFGRRDDPEWVLDYLDRLRAVARSRYLVGVDVMGHETNSTRAFAGLLEEVVRWARSARPGFVVRVHAGENPAHPENVRVAAEAVGGEGVELRIGHGVYGADDATLAALRRARAIVEFNLGSNFALNNVVTLDPGEAPILRYLRAGVPVVLGTDGYGLYGTTLEFEARAATLCGLGEAELEGVRATERAYVDRRAALDAASTDPPDAFDVPDDPPPGRGRYTPAVEVAKREARARRDAALRARLEALGVPLLAEPELLAALRDRRCVAFAGAWRASWDRISPTWREAIAREVRALLDAWEPAYTVVITGGTRHGLEHLVATEAAARGHAVLGALVWATPPDSIAPSALTWATVVGETLYSKAAGLYRLVKDHDGWCLFVGGGPIVADEIQTAANLHVRFLLMDGPEGASTAQARQRPDRAFLTAADALALMAPRPRGAALRYAGPNPAVDAVLVRVDRLGAGSRQVLLVRRRDDARAGAGQWALPGGFVRSDAPPGERWAPGRESLRDACVREVREETGLDLGPLRDALTLVGEREGGGRDPRDTDERWVRSAAFALLLEGPAAEAPVAGGDDAGDAQWIDLERLAAIPLAFDHGRILAEGLARLGGTADPEA